MTKFADNIDRIIAQPVVAVTKNRRVRAYVSHVNRRGVYSGPTVRVAIYEPRPAVVDVMGVGVTVTRDCLASLWIRTRDGWFCGSGAA